MLVILNPTAGSADEEEVAARRERIRRLPDVEVREMQEPGEARRVAAEAADAGYDVVVAAGGDGTVHEVVNGLADAADRAGGGGRAPDAGAPAGGPGLRLPALGVLPLGTANDFARNLGLPLELDEAVDVLARGRRRPVDLGEIGNPATHRFINVSVGGFAGRIEDHMDPDRKRAWGLLSYVRSAVDVLPALEPFRIELEVDGEIERVAAYQVVVANGRRTGGSIPVAPEAELDDGRLDVIVFRGVEPPELVVLAPTILMGQHLDSEAVLFRRAERLTIRSEPPMRFRADGEEVGETPMEFRVRPRALEVLCP